jgi:hypothetical protein
MTIILRFVNKDDFIRELFFDIVNVKDTLISILRDNISYVLFQNCFDIYYVRGQ